MIPNEISPETFAAVSTLEIPAIGILLLILLGLTLSSYVKIVTVLSILRVGLGTNSIPSALVTGGVAIVLSFFVMFPTIQKSFTEVEVARSNDSSALGQSQALSAALGPWKEFLKRHAHKDEIEQFAQTAITIDAEISKKDSEEDEIKEEQQLSSLSETWRILAPAFLVSELKEAFVTGLSLFLPFFIIDLLVASILTTLGMQNLNAQFISLPFKLLLFVMVDGWTLITMNLVATYGS